MSVNPAAESLSDQPFVRSVPGFPGYWIDRAGVVYSKRTRYPQRVRVVRGVPCVELSPRPTSCESPWVPVALLVARTWLPRLRAKDRGKTVRHIDGNPMNVAAINLVWKRP